MIVTEAEALKLRCCGPSDCGEHAERGRRVRRYCVGSECMAWVWQPAEYSTHVLRTVPIPHDENGREINPPYNHKTEGVRMAWEDGGYSANRVEIVQLVGRCNLGHER